MKSKFPAVVLAQHAAVLGVLLLAGCSENMTSRDVDIASRACLDAGMIPHVRYSLRTNEVSRVTCEPK
jgi:hypothetical protein